MVHVKLKEITKSPRNYFIGNEFWYDKKAIDENYSNVGAVIRYPMQNCQMSTISVMYSILDYFEDEEVKDLFKKLFGMDAIQRLVLADVNAVRIERMQKVFGELIRVFPYTSSNGSPMALCIIEAYRL